MNNRIFERGEDFVIKNVPKAVDEVKTNFEKAGIPKKVDNYNSESNVSDSGMQNGSGAKVRTRNNGKSGPPTHDKNNSDRGTTKYSYGVGSFSNNGTPNNVFNNIRNKEGSSFILVICALITLVLLVVIVTTGILRLIG